MTTNIETIRTVGDLYDKFHASWHLYTVPQTSTETRC